MHDGLASANSKAPATAPRRPRHALLPHQQAVHARLLQDIADGLHLSCVSGPRGSGKSTLLQAVRQDAPQALAIVVESTAPGALLSSILAALGLADAGGDSIAARRRLALRLSMAEQHAHAIVIMVDAAHQLTREDAGLLLHFFPSGHATVILAGEGDPASWPALVHTAVADLQAPRVHVLEPLTPVANEASAQADADAPEARAALVEVHNLAYRQERKPRGHARPAGYRRAGVLILITIVVGAAAAVLFERRAQVSAIIASRSLPAPAPQANHALPTSPLFEQASRSPPAEVPASALPQTELPRLSSETTVDPAPAAGTPADAPAPAVSAPPPTLESSFSEATPTPSIAPVSPALPIRPAPEPARADQALDPHPTPSPVGSPAIGRLYAERAEYELNEGLLADARLSVARGLAADPHNRRLLDLRVVVRSAGSPDAPPLPAWPKQR